MRIKFVKTLDNFYYNLDKQGCVDITEDDDYVYIHEEDGYVKISMADIGRIKYTEDGNHG